MMNALILLFVATTRASDTVLMRREHGGGDDRHRDVIGCASDEADAKMLFSAARLLERIVLPDALWCDNEHRCYDSLTGVSYHAMSLECVDESKRASVRCTVRIDCREYIVSFWQSLSVTVAVIIAFILVPGACVDNARRGGGGERHMPMIDYDRDMNL